MEEKEGWRRKKRDGGEMKGGRGGGVIKSLTS